MLCPFGIAPATQRDGNVTFKGYKLAQFKRAFSRYLPDVSGARSQLTAKSPSASSAKKPRNTDVNEQKTAKPTKRKACAGTDQASNKKPKLPAISYTPCRHCAGWGCEECDDIGIEFESL
jgi:hypothetical protein